MAVPNLTKYADIAEQRLTDPTVAAAAASAMVEQVRSVASRHVGVDLRMSRAGKLIIGPESSSGRAAVAVGGAYRLADQGRRRVVRAYARPGSALATPWGPRASVAGSTTKGFAITDEAHASAFKAGRQAGVDSIGWGS
jgi:hypothetical protein